MATTTRRARRPSARAVPGPVRAMLVGETSPANIVDSGQLISRVAMSNLVFVRQFWQCGLDTLDTQLLWWLWSVSGLPKPECGMLCTLGSFSFRAGIQGFAVW
jgi:hypothetical protein